MPETITPSRPHRPGFPNRDTTIAEFHDYYSPKPRFCVDCRHHTIEQYGDQAHDACTRSYGPRVDLVTGEPITTRPTLSCRAQRQAASLGNVADAMKAGGLCGPFGHYWQPREACPEPVEAGEAE